MDPFEVRLQFVTLLSRLSSSLQSINKCTSFALKHAPRCADDIWDCVMEECMRASLNSRINLLYLVDQLLDSQQPPNSQPFLAFANRDLAQLVNNVVPDSKLGSLNLMSATQVLNSWKTRRVFEASVLDPILDQLQQRRTSTRKPSAEDKEQSQPNKMDHFSRNDILRRIEDDRERHKRLRERIWVLPVPTSIFTISAIPSSLSSTQPLSQPGTATSAKPSPASPASPSEQPQTPGPSKSSTARTTRAKQLAASESTSTPNVSSTLSTSTSARGPHVPIEIEFDQLWDAARAERKEQDESNDGHDGSIRKRTRLTQVDVLAMQNERKRCFVDGM
ncbi:hypothetical protein ACM66B_000916 [Microbotryomycetes sp. NB124-2]